MTETLSLQDQPLLNGSFDHFPDTTSVTAANKIGVSHSLVTLGTGGSPAATVSRQAFVSAPYPAQMGNPPTEGDPGGYPDFSLRWAQTALASTTNPELQHRIEHVRTFAGLNKAVYRGFYRSNQPIQVGMRQNFGSGGSPTADVDGALQTLPATTDASGVVQWRAFKLYFSIAGIVGATLGTTANTSFLAIRVLGPLNVTFQYDLWDVALHRADFEGAAKRRTYSEEYFLLQRYFLAVSVFAPVSTQSPNGYLFPRQMRIAPTITSTGATSGNITADGASIISAGAAAQIALTADARL